MPQLVSTRLAAQLHRRTVDHAYTDTGYYIAAPSLGSLNDYGQPSATGTQTLVACSFTDKPAVEKWQGYVDTAEIAAEVRFATPTPDKGGQFTLTGRFGETVTEQTFEIIGVQNRGVFGFVCALKAVVI